MDEQEQIQRAPSAREPTSFTPGPWIMQRRRDGDIEVGPPEQNAPQHVNGLATVYGDDRDPNCWPVTANANLIAAAPELYEALRLTLDWVPLHAGKQWGQLLDQIVAALKKAEAGNP